MRGTYYSRFLRAFKNAVANLRFRYFIDDHSQFIAGSHCEHENTSKVLIIR